jgi:N utilization substance protein A
LVNGTVQSISGQHITIGLGRTEAILPKSQQVRGERYRAHDKIRVYVLEVRRTSRGPQIFVSRNHRNLLRRLLELEVPEIYNGQVEIKSIAREAGQRSKVAVMALQPGVDPVGACVGMRGVRIQSIVRELNDEKIDVIEWNPDQKTFIAKALSPARVSHVFLDDHPDDGKTAVVVVPDDQLSLAIGREGQNARLGAKLTGWRIDIKSLTESAADSLERLDDPAVAPALAENEQFLEQVRSILAKKAANRPITSEDYFTLDRLVNAVEGQIIAARSAEHDKVRMQRAEARKEVPAIAWELSLDELDLPGRIHNLLLDNEVETVGHVLMNLAVGDDVFLNYRGFGDKALETLKEYVANYDLPVVEAETEVEVEAEVEPGEPAEVEEAAIAEVEAVVEEPVEVVEEVAAPEAIEQPEPEPEVEAEAEIEAEAEEPEEIVPAIDDLSRPLIEITEEPEKKKETKKKPSVVIARPDRAEERLEEQEKQSRRKGKRLVFDEDMGEVVIERKRKRGRGRPDWEDYDLEDY